MVLHTYALRVKYSCGVVLVLWFWQEIIFGVTYVLSVQYSCTIVSVCWLWQEIVISRLDMYHTKVLMYRTMVLMVHPTKVRR